DFLFALLAVSLIAYFFEKVRNGYELGLKQRQLILEEERAELKEARDQLIKAGEELENKVSERTEELTKANTQLREEIEDRLRFEEALQKSEERYRLHFENASDAIYTINKDLKIETVSPSAEDLLGFKEEELVGKSFSDVQVLAPEYREKAISEIMRVLGGERILASEYGFIAKDGKRFFGEISGSPLIKNDEIIGMVSVARDITDRKKAEEERAGLEKRLMKAQKMEAIGTLAGGIAHDFNNLLMGMQGRTSLMLIDKDSSHPDFEHLKGIEDYVKSAADLTNQLLGFARGGKYEVKPIDLNDLIKASSQMFGRAKKEIRIRTELQPDLWITKADEKQIEQVLLNLYINAWQAMLEGGELYLQTENVRLTEDYANAHQVEPGKYAKISVTDTGIGMDKATMQRIFDPFFTMKGMGRGTGLGLASVYGIVRNHDGFIDVYSEKGHGTTFVINLPASEQEATRKMGSSEEPLRGSGTILLVDDEDMSAYYLPFAAFKGTCLFRFRSYPS
ncbi:MAG: PAS domain S-box protein, partial [Deltaproteobacteria bacterium]|nr:PAS domain S-box protein [Deltaproteobacteria bacterium]